MVRLFLIIVAIVLIVVGAIVFPMPIPLGLIMMVLGLALLITQSPFVAGRVRAFRARHARTDQAIRKVENVLPAKLRDALKRTDP